MIYYVGPLRIPVETHNKDVCIKWENIVKEFQICHAMQFNKKK